MLASSTLIPLLIRRILVSKYDAYLKFVDSVVAYVELQLSLVPGRSVSIRQRNNIIAMYEFTKTVLEKSSKLPKPVQAIARSIFEHYEKLAAECAAEALVASRPEL